MFEWNFADAFWMAAIGSSIFGIVIYFQYMRRI